MCLCLDVLVCTICVRDYICVLCVCV
uniref:Uncharacterized protein n=1 Tax=Anguilla anguilla TaxID=7936 RepID=A0A0E9SWX1_ANGAN